MMRALVLMPLLAAGCLIMAGILGYAVIVHWFEGPVLMGVLWSTGILSALASLCTAMVIVNVVSPMHAQGQQQHDCAADDTDAGADDDA
ncbi:MAG: hypothetical protein QW838_05955 [Candidatus Nitrosotenuis sp.]